MGEVGESRRWEARSRGYDLLARLVRDGPTHLRPALEIAGLTGFQHDDDDAAADHQRWLTREVLPWESVYLTPERLLGGPRGAQLAPLAARLPLRSAEPDHLGRELEIAGWLCGALGDAHADGRDDEVVRVSARLTAFLSHHLGAWVGFPAIACAGVPGWGQALALAAELVADSGGAPQLPPEPDVDPLAEGAGLRDVADWLATPLATGVAWTHATLQEIGSESKIPIGFGTRTDQLESLLRNAADHRRVPEVAAVLDRALARWEAAWGNSPWRPRVGRARRVVSRLGAVPRSPATP